MVLNFIWIAFIVIAFIVALVQLIFFGNPQVFSDVINSTFASAKSGFEISLGLTGVLSLWLGIMKIGENGGVLKTFSRLVAPFFCKIFPEVPKDHPAMGSMFMNISANMLGLDNAATPMGLKAMGELQEVNAKKDTASNPMIMFLVLNTAGMTLIPISVMVYRAQLGAANPADVFLPIVLATYFAALTGWFLENRETRIKILFVPYYFFIMNLSVVLGFFRYMKKSQSVNWERAKRAS
jgi:spore maturation protein SpmA